MPKGVELTEFYLENQGRPASTMKPDMETNQQAVAVGTGMTRAFLAAVVITLDEGVITKDGDIVYRG